MFIPGLFARFQRETRQRLEELAKELHAGWFELSRRYLYSPPTTEIERVRTQFLETIRQVVTSNRQLVVMEEHIPTGQLVTDAWRKVFEDINDYLALEAGRQMRGLVGPLLTDIEQRVDRLQKELVEVAAGGVDESFWTDYRRRLALLRERLQNQAEALSLGYYTNNRFSVYDEAVSRSLQVGDAYRRRDEVARLLQDRVNEWFSALWQLVCRLALTDLAAFSAELRYYGLGLEARDSLLVELEAREPGAGIAQFVPESSLLAALIYRYQADEAFRQRYARREPSPVERLTLEIRDWLALLKPPVKGLGELSKAVAIVGVGGPAAAATFTAAGRHASANDNDSLATREGSLSGNEAGLNSAGPVAATNNLQSASGGEVKVGNWPLPGEAREAGAGIKDSTTPSGGEKASSKIPTSSPAVGATVTVAPTYNRLSVPVESHHPYAPLTRQFWEISNPDASAAYTRLHFSRVELGGAAGPDGQPARIVVEAFGRQYVITGQHRDFWTDKLPGRHISVRFFAENSAPGWGFVLDGVQSVN